MPTTWFFQFKLFTVLFILLFCIDVYGQNKSAIGQSTVYSIPGVARNQLESVLNGNQTVESILPLIERLSRQNPPIALYVVNELLLSGISQKYTTEWAQLTYCKIWLQLESFSEHEELELLRERIKECISIFEEQKQLNWLAKCYSLQSSIAYNISYNNGDSLYTEASRFNDRALNLMLKSPNDAPGNYSILGEIYRIRGNICLNRINCSIDTALFNYDTGLEYYILNKDRSGQADILLNKAISFKEAEGMEQSFPQQENPIKYFEDAISICEELSDLLKVRLEFSIYLQQKYEQTKDEKWNKQSNEQLQKIIKASGTKKSEAYCQLAINHQTFLSYSASTLPEQTQNQLLDSIINFYRMTLFNCKEENNLKVYNDIFKRLAIVCPYFPKEECSRLLAIANEVKTYFLQKNKAINQEITSRNEAFQMAIDAQERRNMKQMGIIFFILLSVLFLGTIVWQRFKALKANLAIKQETIRAREQALRAQMNPHFISNSINAIESLVNQERNEEASEYLIDFSRLCRQVISHSRDARISLKEEIKTLGHFLSLEKLRLTDDLEYSISVDNQLDSSIIMVPPMLLQPFVENAIWHGIKNKPEPRKGELKIKINKLSEHVLECIIEDNGVGRKKAMTIQKDSVMDQKSWGVTLTKERISYLEKGNKASLEWVDLYDNKGEARGTRVNILLPI